MAGSEWRWNRLESDPVRFLASLIKLDTDGTGYKEHFAPEQSFWGKLCIELGLKNDDQDRWWAFLVFDLNVDGIKTSFFSKIRPGQVLVPTATSTPVRSIAECAACKGTSGHSVKMVTCGACSRAFHEFCVSFIQESLSRRQAYRCSACKSKRYQSKPMVPALLEHQRRCQPGIHTSKLPSPISKPGTTSCNKTDFSTKRTWKTPITTLPANPTSMRSVTPRKSAPKTLFSALEFTNQPLDHAENAEVRLSQTSNQVVVPVIQTEAMAPNVSFEISAIDDHKTANENGTNALSRTTSLSSTRDSRTLAGSLGGQKHSPHSNKFALPLGQSVLQHSLETYTRKENSLRLNLESEKLSALVVNGKVVDVPKELTLNFSTEEWNLVFRIGARKLKTGWTHLFRKKFAIINPACVLAFKWHELAQFRSHFTFSARAICKHKNCLVYNFAVKSALPLTNAGLSIFARGTGTYCHAPNVTYSSFISSNLRDEVKDMLSGRVPGRVATSFYEKQDITALLSGNASGLPSKKVFHHINQELMKSMDLDPHPFTSLVLQYQKDRENKENFMFMLHWKSLRVAYYHSMQVMILKELRKLKPLPVAHLDATGNLIRPLIDHPSRNKLLLYTLAVAHPKETQPGVSLMEAITNDHTAGGISIILLKYAEKTRRSLGIRRNDPIFSRIETDHSYAQMHAISIVFFRVDFSRYLNDTWKVIVKGKSAPSTFMHICRIHSLNFINKQIAKAYGSNKDARYKVMQNYVHGYLFAHSMISVTSRAITLLKALRGPVMTPEVAEAVYRLKQRTDQSTDQANNAAITWKSFKQSSSSNTPILHRETVWGAYFHHLDSAVCSKLSEDKESGPVNEFYHPSLANYFLKEIFFLAPCNTHLMFPPCGADRKDDHNQPAEQDHRAKKHEDYSHFKQLLKLNRFVEMQRQTLPGRCKHFMSGLMQKGRKQYERNIFEEDRENQKRSHNLNLHISGATHESVRADSEEFHEIPADEVGSENEKLSASEDGLEFEFVSSSLNEERQKLDNRLDADTVVMLTSNTDEITVKSPTILLDPKISGCLTCMNEDASATKDVLVDILEDDTTYYDTENWQRRNTIRSNPRRSQTFVESLIFIPWGSGGPIPHPQSIGLRNTCPFDNILQILYLMCDIYPRVETAFKNDLEVPSQNFLVILGLLKQRRFPEAKCMYMEKLLEMPIKLPPETNDVYGSEDIYTEIVIKKLCGTYSHRYLCAEHGEYAVEKNLYLVGSCMQNVLNLILAESHDSECAIAKCQHIVSRRIVFSTDRNNTFVAFDLTYSGHDALQNLPKVIDIGNKKYRIFAVTRFNGVNHYSATFFYSGCWYDYDGLKGGFRKACCNDKIGIVFFVEM